MSDEIRKCLTCGNELNYPAWNQKYCSKRHRDQDVYKKRLKKNAQGLTWEKLRFIVLARDGFRCLFCGRSPAEHGVILVPDHWLPIAKNGLNIIENLVTSCWDCNSAKRDMVIPYRVKPRIRVLSKNELAEMLGKDYNKLQNTSNLPLKSLLEI